MSAKRSQRKQEESARQPPEQLVVGRVARPHGVRGSLVVEPASQVIESLRPGSVVFLGEYEQAFTIENIRPHHSRFLIALEGIADRNDAEQYRDLDVKLSFADSDPLEEHEYYYWQILGLQVITEQGEELGEVISIIETGANDVYVVQSDSGKELLLPAIGDVVITVDLENQQLVVRLLPGLQDG
jgi:16S rRNA processing protein RimM